MSDTDLAKIAGAQTVLVVDEEVLIRLALADYLRECGYRVIEAASAPDAMTVLDAGDVTIDVVLSDLHLPGPTNGFALVKWVRENHPEVPVILATTAAKAAEAAADLCDSGPLLSRPYEPQAVVDRIRRLLGNGGKGGGKVAKVASCAARPGPLGIVRADLTQ